MDTGLEVSGNVDLLDVVEEIGSSTAQEIQYVDEIVIERFAHVQIAVPVPVQGETDHFRFDQFATRVSFTSCKSIEFKFELKFEWKELKELKDS